MLRFGLPSMEMIFSCRVMYTVTSPRVCGTIVHDESAQLRGLRRVTEAGKKKETGPYLASS